MWAKIVAWFSSFLAQLGIGVAKAKFDANNERRETDQDRIDTLDLGATTAREKGANDALERAQDAAEVRAAPATDDAVDEQLRPPSRRKASAVSKSGSKSTRKK